MKKLFLTFTLAFSLCSHSQLTEVISGLSRPYGLAVDSASNLYISETNKISMMFLNDGVPAIFDLFTSNVNNPTKLKIANNYLYVVETGANRISRFNLLSGPPQLAAYVTAGLTSPRAVDASGSNLIVGDYGSYAIKKINTAVNPFQASILDQDLATDIVIDNDLYYYANPVYGYVKSNTFITPGTVSNPVITDILHPSSLLLHDNWLYVSDSQEGKIYRINPNSSSTTSHLLLSGLNAPESMVVFNNELYIAESGANRIVKISLNTLANPVFENPSVSISPNPVQNMLYINTLDQVREVTVYNLLGKTVLTAASNNNLDLSHLTNGIYIVNIITDKGSSSHKLTKN